MAGSNREARLARYRAQMAEKEEGKAKEEMGSYPKVTHPEYCTAPKGTPMVFRPMSYGSELNPKTGTDHRFYYYSFMVDDNGKYFPFSWGFEDWKKSPIYEIVKTVGKYDWDAKTRTRTYENEGCELLTDITCNGKPDAQYPSGWDPNKNLLMNVIDRTDDWCKENKHSKVITNKAEYDEENDRWRTDYGFKSVQYNAIVEAAEKQVGSICDFDFLTVKFKTPKGGRGEKKQYYETVLAEISKPYIEENFGKEYVDMIFEDYDEEEMSYEMYNFEEMDVYQPSSIGYFLSKKSAFVKAVDEKYKTDFFTKLSKLADEEKATRGETVETTTEETKVKEAIKTENPITEEVVKPSRRVVKEEALVEESGKFDPKSLDPSEFKGISKLTETELDLIVGVSDDGTLIFAEGCSMEPCEKEYCKCDFPVDFCTCPYCSAEYM